MIPKQLSQQFNILETISNTRTETKEERYERILKTLGVRKHGKGKRKRTKKKGGKR